MSQQWSASFNHPELTIQQTVTPAEAEVEGKIGLPFAATLSFHTANPNVQSFIQMLIQVAIQTAPIWIPLLVGTTPPAANQGK